MKIAAVVMMIEAIPMLNEGTMLPWPSLNM
jgi:hypothetical protein